MADQTNSRNYESLEPKEQSRFNSVYYNELLKLANSGQDPSIQEFYDEVWGKFSHSKEIKQSQEIPKNHAETKTHKSSKYHSSSTNLDPYQQFVKEQRKLRKEEFKNYSNAKVQKILSCEWFVLSELEKSRIIETNGKFRY